MPGLSHNRRSWLIPSSNIRVTPHLFELENRRPPGNVTHIAIGSEPVLRPKDFLKLFVDTSVPPAERPGCRKHPVNQR